MREYVIAIDGGGTKTLGVLYDSDGREITRTVQGFSNFAVNQDLSRTHIAKTIARLIESIDDNASVIIQIGIAGFSQLKTACAYEKELEARFNAPVNIVSDADIALHAVAGGTDETVLMAIGGTGSAVMVKDGTNIMMRGGFGHLLGDPGSAYHVVIEALKKVVCEEESGQERSLLSERLLTAIGADDYRDIKSFLYGNDKNAIAALSKTIGEAAGEHDADAIRLLKEEGRLLAVQLVRAAKTIDNKATLKIALHGGFVEHAPYVKKSVLDELDENLNDYHIIENTTETVKGAYHLAVSRLTQR